MKREYWLVLASLGLVVVGGGKAPAQAQTPCTTVLECAQAAVGAASRSQAEVATLTKRLADAEARLQVLRTRRPQVDYQNCDFFRNWGGQYLDEDLGTDRIVGRQRTGVPMEGRDIRSTEQCPADMVLVGVANGRGHSSNFNEQHGLKCCLMK